MGMNIGKAYYEPFYMGYDIYKEIAKYQGEVLIVHGTEDSLVKPEYSAKASNVYDPFNETFPFFLHDIHSACGMCSAPVR